MCGGLGSGLALALLPLRWWARMGAALGASAAYVARSALTPALLGAAFAQLRRDDTEDAATTTQE
ncbi:MAG: hypothetical protein ACREPN_08705 [Rudaea sp.]